MIIEEWSKLENRGRNHWSWTRQERNEDSLRDNIKHSIYIIVATRIKREREKRERELFEDLIAGKLVLTWERKNIQA